MKRTRGAQESGKAGKASSKRARQAVADAHSFDDSVFTDAVAAVGQASIESRRAKKNKSTSKWDGEQAYESLPRKVKTKKESVKLPVRDAEKERWNEVEGPTLEDESDDGATDDDEVKEADETATDATPEKPQLSSKQQILAAKEELAKTASLLNEDPEKNVGGLRDLQELAESENYTVKQLALLTQLTVYKDIIPGYRIRPLSETDSTTKVTKEIRQLRDYEQRLVAGYKKYIDTLDRLTKAPSKSDDPVSSSSSSSHSGRDVKAAAALSSVAVSCACNLLVSVPHFNFRSDLITILTRKVSVRHQTADMDRCVAAFEQLFREDEDGYASTEAVATLAKMIKARKLSVHESVLNVFLQLRLLTEFSHKGSAAGVSSTGSTSGHGAEHDGGSNDVADKINKKQFGRKVKRQQREFKTKKERKHLREVKELESEMAEADATVSHEDRDRMQAESLKLVFGVYFRVLKARVRHLMGAVLEGLARYAHLINQDFFGDIVEALRELVSDREAEAAAAARIDADGDGDGDDGAGALDGGVDEDGNPINDGTFDGSAKSRDAAREALLCAITAFALLDGQQGGAAAKNSSLGLDLTFFVGHLYRTLLPLSIDPDIDLSYRRVDKATEILTSADDSASSSPTPNRVNFQTTIVLLIRSLSSTLLPTHQALRSIPTVRIAAFCKRLLTLSAQLPEKSAIAVLGLVTQVAKAHGRRIAGMWFTEERKADGLFDPHRTDLDASNPFATTVWEGEILRMHYCPAVRRAGKEIEKAIMSQR